jgi:hypothetical protein
VTVAPPPAQRIPSKEIVSVTGAQPTPTLEPSS